MPTTTHKMSAPETTQKQHEQVGHNVVVAVASSSSCMACWPRRQAKTTRPCLKKHKNGNNVVVVADAYSSSSTARRAHQQSKRESCHLKNLKKQHEQVGNNVVIIIAAAYSSSCTACRPRQQPKTKMVRATTFSNSSRSRSSTTSRVILTWLAVLKATAVPLLFAFLAVSVLVSLLFWSRHCRQLHCWPSSHSDSKPTTAPSIYATARTSACTPLPSTNTFANTSRSDSSTVCVCQETWSLRILKSFACF